MFAIIYQGASEIWKIILKRPFVTSSQALRIVYFDFNGRAAISNLSACRVAVRVVAENISHASFGKKKTTTTTTTIQNRSRGEAGKYFVLSSKV